MNTLYIVSDGPVNTNCWVFVSTCPLESLAQTGYVVNNATHRIRDVNILENILNPYERRARLGPMLIALAPVIALLVLYLPGFTNITAKSATAILVFGTLSTLLANLARQAGKRVEPTLKKQWGGWPSMMIFRHRDSWIDPITKSNIHKAMAKAVASTYAPTPDQEIRDPGGCDNIYLAWSEHLRKLARNNEKKFPHVFRENMSYGFHRNLYGLKAFAIIVLLVSAVVTSWVAWQKYKPTQSVPMAESICLGLFAIGLLVWLFVITAASVKRASYDYASRLIDDCVPDLPAKTARPRQPKKV